MDMLLGSLMYGPLQVLANGKAFCIIKGDFCGTELAVVLRSKPETLD